MAHQPIVYVVQQGQVNLTPAQSFGKIKVILPEGDLMFSPAPAVRKLREALNRFTEHDYLLALGDPTAIGIACVLVSERLGGRFRMLKWDRQEKRYLDLDIDVHDRAAREQLTPAG